MARIIITTDEGIVYETIEGVYNAMLNPSDELKLKVALRQAICDDIQTAAERIQEESA